AGDSRLKFAVGKTSGINNITIYGLVQCTPDLISNQCSDCLIDVISKFSYSYSGKIGGRTLLPMCNFRYEIYPFRYENSKALNQTPSSLPAPAPSPPSLQVSSPSPGIKLRCILS
ncbi:cysteine-rich receptor-like protein kinase 26, partial [Tanacetum coccineum]